LILSIDQGTSSTKCCVFDPAGELLALGTVPVSRRTLADGSVVQDPRELTASCLQAATRALAEGGLRPADLYGVALANQGESFLLVDSRGRPLTPVISWQDSLTGEVFEGAAVRANAEEIAWRTGLPLHPEFVAPRLAFRLAELGDDRRGARLATLDTWLIQELSKDAPFITDRATASRTMLIGLESSDWDDDLIGWFGLDRERLATIVPCDRPGVTLNVNGTELPLLVSGYDMGLALLGHGCVGHGDVKATFGTCLGVMAATGSDLVRAPGLLSTVAYTQGERRAMALDGEILAAGALIDWAVRIGIARSADELDRIATGVKDAAGVMLVPAIDGLGAPHWRDHVSATFTGLTSATRREHLARAVYESIAWSLRDVLESIRAAGIHLDRLRVDGGLTRRGALMQLCADVCQVPLAISAVTEGTAFGAAALAMLGPQVAAPSFREAAARDAGFIAPGRFPGQGRAAAWEQAVLTVLEAGKRERRGDDGGLSGGEGEP
jgi:glycerol kinase